MNDSKGAKISANPNRRLAETLVEGRRGALDFSQYGFNPSGEPVTRQTPARKGVYQSGADRVVTDAGKVPVTTYTFSHKEGYKLVVDVYESRRTDTGGLQVRYKWRILLPDGTPSVSFENFPFSYGNSTLGRLFSNNTISPEKRLDKLRDHFVDIRRNARNYSLTRGW